MEHDRRELRLPVSQFLESYKKDIVPWPELEDLQIKDRTKAD